MSEQGLRNSAAYEQSKADKQGEKAYDEVKAAILELKQQDLNDNSLKKLLGQVQDAANVLPPKTTLMGQEKGSPDAVDF